MIDSVLLFLHNLVLPLSIAYVILEGRSMLQDLLDRWRSTPGKRSPLDVLVLAVYFLNKMTSCSKCLSFWSTLVLTHSLPLACVASILFDTFDRIRFRYL